MTAPTRVIKRYANRKLYDTQASCYVTLEQVSDLIRQGDDVQVVDNSTKEDMTSVTFAQIIFEEEKRRKSFLPLSALQKIIRTGGVSLHELVAQIHQSAGRVGRVFRREDEEGGEPGSLADGDADGTGLAGAPDAGDGGEMAEPVGVIRDFMENIQVAVDDWQRRLDQNVQNAWETVSPLGPLQREIRALNERIEEMERRIPGRSAKTSAGGASKTSATGASKTSAGGASKTSATGASKTSATGASKTSATGASKTSATDASKTSEQPSTQKK